MEQHILLLMLITGTLAYNDLKSNVFVFPKPTASAHVILKADLTKPLEKVTVCMKSYSELTRPHSLFSLALEGKDNAFLIFPNSQNFCSVYINQEEIKIRINEEKLSWKHTCVTWDSTTGVLQLWVNGKVYPRRFSNKGFTIGPKTSIILGQEQDSFGGGFDINQSFFGEISDFHMWDYVLTPENILSGDYQGNLINWNSLSYEIKGNVLVEPKLQCLWEGLTSSYDQCYGK